MTEVTTAAFRLRHTDKVQQLNLNAFDDFNDQSLSRRILLEDPVMRTVLVSLRSGQGLPAHPADGLVSIYTISGQVQFTLADETCELTPGTLVRVPPGVIHQLQAQQDSKLLVTLIRPSDAAVWNSLSPSGQDLDLRPTPRPRRHSTVFYAFDQLAAGESFFIINDHDPQPLRWQIEEARPGEMSWEYVERGPEKFRIRVTRVAAASTPASPSPSS